MPAIGGRQPVSITYRDATGETSSVRLYVGEITAVSLPGLLTQIGTLTAATDAITLGIRSRESWGEETTVSNDTPTNQAAQREAKLFVQYRGNTTEKPYSLTVPTVDFSVLNFVPGGGDAVIFSGAGASAAILAWVAAFEDMGKAPDDEAEEVTVYGMRFVGRNS